MAFWHRHNWQEVLRTYAPPVPPGGDFSGGLELFEFLDRCKFGLTTVLWRCKDCHEFRKDEMFGKEVDSAPHG